MLFYQLDYTIEKVLETGSTAKQSFLEKIANARFSKQEAEYIWEKIKDHKWCVSEKLGRDVGIKVAALDYLENINRAKLKGNSLNDDIINRNKILSLV